MSLARLEVHDKNTSRLGVLAKLQVVADVETVIGRADSKLVTTDSLSMKDPTLLDSVVVLCGRTQRDSFAFRVNAHGLT